MIKLPSLPVTDPDWLSLPDAERDSVCRWMSALRSMPEGLPLRGQGGRLDYLARRLGVSMAVARERYYAWRKSQDWHTLVDGRTLRAASRPEGVNSPQFIAWGKRYVESNQRGDRQALKEIRAIILSGTQIIPGLENWTSRHKLPPGCSEANLRRLLCKSKAERTAARYGMRAAAQYLPYVRTTRTGLRVGMQYMFDDVWHDHYVLWNGKPVRILEYGAHDVFSGNRFHSGFMPRIIDDERGTNRGLTNQMFRLFLAYCLRYCGYDQQSCQLMMEHGSATLPEHLISLLRDGTDGVIQVGMGGITGKETAMIGGWAGRGAGNPRYKSMIECFHSLMHNIMGFLPGQTGTNRHQPESTDGMIRYQATLSKVADRLGINKGLLKSPFLSMEQFSLVLKDVYFVLNNRTDHTLEGWREAGLIIREYQLSEGLWTPEMALPNPDDGDNQRMAIEAIRALVLADPKRLRERRLSPAEVWQTQAPGLAKLPLSLYAMLLGEDCTRSVKVRRGYMTIQDKELCPEPRLYKAQIYTPQSRWEYLNNEETYDVVLNPYDAAHLIIKSARGGIKGEAFLDIPVSRANQTAVEHAIGRVAAHKTALMSDLRSRHTQDRAEVAALKAYNDDIITLAQGGLAKAEQEAITLTGTEQRAVTREAKIHTPHVDIFAGLGSLPDASDNQAPATSFESTPVIALDDIIFHP